MAVGAGIIRFSAVLCDQVQCLASTLHRIGHQTPVERGEPAAVAHGERQQVGVGDLAGLQQAGAVDAAGIDSLLDAVISVDPIKIYKPRAEVYRLVTDHYKCKPADIVFVSSNRWDVMAGMHNGFKGVWVNRAKNPDEYGLPDKMLPDLASLPDLAI